MAEPSTSLNAPRRGIRVSARLLAVCIFCASAVVGAVSASQAAPKWLTPRDLSETSGNGVIPDITVDTNGNVYAIWAQVQGPRWTVHLAERRVGGEWSKPKTLSAAADHVGSPEVIAAGGRVVAVWERWDGKNLIAQTSSRNPSTGRWSPPESLPPIGRDAISPRLALNERGDAVIIWASLTATGWTVQSSYRVGGGSWRPDADLEVPLPGTVPPAVVLDPAGNAIAVWGATKGGRWTVRSSYRKASSGKWSRAVDISGLDSSGSLSPQIAIEPDGDAVAVWSRTDAKGTTVEQSTRKGSTGAWSAPRRLSSGGVDAVAPLIATNKRGDAAVVWTNSGPAGLTVAATFRRSGGDWERPVALSRGAAGPVTPQLALDEAGDMTVVWTHSVAGHSLVQASTRDPNTGTWTKPQTLSKRGSDSVTPQIAVDLKGDGAVIWSHFQSDQQYFVVQATGYDTSGPELERLVVPSGGVAGAKLAFSVAPRDVWSSIRTIRWSFGDGGGAAGLRASHAYAKPGRYMARITVSDSSGNVTTARRAVKIAAS